MSDQKGTAEPERHIFVGLFEFDNRDTDESGSFQIVLEASDPDDAAARFRARLDELARVTDTLGPIVVYNDGFLKLSRGSLKTGMLINYRSGEEGEESFDAPFPEQGFDDGGDFYPGEQSMSVEEADKLTAEGDTRSDLLALPVFWDGVEIYRAKWKLFWCETHDHNEDWFVVARNAKEATRFFEDSEGYNEGDADAELVCVLPHAEQLKHKKKGASWPSPETIIACGGEFVANVPQDGANGIRQIAGSGSRLVRINERIYGEGDIVGNVLRSLGKSLDS